MLLLGALRTAVVRVGAEPVVVGILGARAGAAAAARLVALVVVALAGQHLHFPHLLLPNVIVVILQCKARTCFIYGAGLQCEK